MDKIEQALSNILQKEEARIGGSRKIYISHPYGGKEENKERVECIVSELIRNYPQHTFVSPIHCFGYLYNEVEYDQGLRYCLDLLDMCDEMWVYGDFMESKGCKAEINHAMNTMKQFKIKE